MAGKDVYLGKMMESLDLKIDSLMTAMDNQVLKMDDQIAALNTVNTTVAQSISAGNLMPGPGNSCVVNGATDVTRQTETLFEVGRAKIFGNGKIRALATMKTSSGSVGNNGYIYYSINGGTSTLLGSVLNTSYQTIQKDIAVNYLDEIVFSLRSSGTSPSVTLQAESLKIEYDVINLVVNGFVNKA
jgi:hypothetical protein